MAGKTNYVEAAVVAWMVGKTAMPALPTTYIALFTAAPSDAGGGTEFTGLARKVTAGSDWTTPAGTPRSSSNSTVQDFGTVTVAGTVTHFALMDAASGGNMLGWAALTNSRTFAIGDGARFAVGALVVQDD
jgi:hypothetical protein